MNSGWQTKRLGDLCEIELGKTPARANKAFWDVKRETSNVWLSIADLLNAEDNLVLDSREYLSEKGAAISKIVRKGTLLVSFKLTLGRLAFAGRDLFTNEAIAALTIFNERELSKEFLFYFLHFFDWRKAAENDVKLKGMTLNKAKLRELRVPFPPLSEQRRIVGILDTAFEGIATAKANTEKNLLNARAIFESYLQSSFTRPNQGWFEQTLADVCDQITDGKHGDCQNDVESGYYFLSAKDIKNGTLNFENARQITRSDFEETHRRTNLAPGDILITNSGTIGRMAIAPLDPRTDKTTFQKSVAILKPKRKIIDSGFAFYCLSSGLARFMNLSAGAAQKNLLLRDLRSYRFFLPVSLEAQRNLTNKLNSLSTQTQRLEAVYQLKLARLEALKKSLLNQAFMGQLTMCEQLQERVA